MKGYFHEMVTVTYGACFILPFLYYEGLDFFGFIPPLMTGWFIIMVMWGSLVPDVDASDSRFFHLNPYASRFFKYVIYYPVAKITGSKKHRGIMHTLEGLAITTIYFTSIVFLIVLFSFIVGAIFLLTTVETILEMLISIEKVNIDLIYFLFFIIITAAGLGFGIFGHVLEDSLTVSGIKWRFKANQEMKGPLRVGGSNEQIVAFTWAGAGAILLLVEFMAAREGFVFGLMVLLVSVGVFLSFPLIVRTNVFRKILGEDELIIDVRTREKAKKDAFSFKHENVNYKVETGRVKRGLKIVDEVDVEKMKVGNYQITRNEEGLLSCNCKDFKKMKEYTTCKHVIAYMVKTKPKIKSGLLKKTQ
jgi:uncharacterized metal-binding protein